MAVFRGTRTHTSSTSTSTSTPQDLCDRSWHPEHFQQSRRSEEGTREELSITSSANSHLHALHPHVMSRALGPLPRRVGYPNFLSSTRRLRSPYYEYLALATAWSGALHSRWPVLLACLQPIPSTAIPRMEPLNPSREHGNGCHQPRRHWSVGPPLPSLPSPLPLFMQTYVAPVASDPTPLYRGRPLTGQATAVHAASQILLLGPGLHKPLYAHLSACRTRSSSPYQLSHGAPPSSTAVQRPVSNAYPASLLARHISC